VTHILAHGSRPRRVVLWLCAFCAALLLGCAQESGTPVERFQRNLDAGNEAYRAKQYDDALRFYKKAVQAKPGSPEAGAGYFGMYMVYSVKGRQKEADEAFAKAKELSPALGGQPHPLPGEGGGAGGMMGGASGMAGLAAMSDSGITRDSSGASPEWVRKHVESMRGRVPPRKDVR
jgi:tetratricopeptide (TPR) repeat protein